ncbi:MAG: class E sortase [Frankiaceae bacterium]|nr:class E sortase [Frankiaceae bacterium]
MSDAVRTALRGLGQTLMTLGVIVLLFCVYELKVTGLVTAREQDRLGDDLRASWADPAPRPTGADPVPVSSDIGEGIAVLHVPALADYDPWVVVEGTSVADLKAGPGHIPGTALPGEVGNVVLSGHRTTYGAPFERFGDLQPGGLVVLETRDRWLTYTITGSQIVAPTAIEVTYPVPGEQGAVPTERLLTLTTCHPKYSARQRLIVSATLTEDRDKADGPPAELEL